MRLGPLRWDNMTTQKPSCCRGDTKATWVLTARQRVGHKGCLRFWMPFVTYPGQRHCWIWKLQIKMQLSNSVIIYLLLYCSKFFMFIAVEHKKRRCEECLLFPCHYYWMGSTFKLQNNTIKNIGIYSESSDVRWLVRGTDQSLLNYWMIKGTVHPPK